MNKRVVQELVNAYAEDVVKGRSTADARAAILAQYAKDATFLDGLFKLTDELSELLVPVSASAEFVQALDSHLIESAVPPEIIIGQRPHRRLWLGALVSGSLVSAIGLILFWWLRRSRRGALVSA